MPRLHPKRREFLTSLVSAGIVGLAGCSGEGTSDASPTETASPSPSPSPTPTTPNQEALDHYEPAIATLIENKETLDAWAESSFEPEQVTALQDRVSLARDELTAAKEAADPAGELIQQINQATLVADFQELSLAYYEAVNVFFQVISEANQFGNNELHQRAADTYADAGGVLDDARQVIEDMGTVLAAIDTEALGEPELEYTGKPLDYLDLANLAAVDAAERYAGAHEDLHLSFVQFEAGQEHSDNEEFSEARAEWETGLARAEEAKAGFEAVIDNDYTPENLRQDSIGKLSAAETMIAAFDTFIEGATAAEAGNLEEATQLFSEGLDILGELE